ncbi:MarC family protein [Nonomuraea sp. NPDC049152]|uniref:MarC family protein n=1 Tax=Nonomuraea sp. NPDC049152 TaxID=3154350 RepID=UPI0033EAD621
MAPRCTGWLSTPAFTGYLRDNSLGRKRVAGPVLDARRPRVDQGALRRPPGRFDLSQVVTTRTGRRPRSGLTGRTGCALSVAALCFAAVTGVTLYLSGHVQRRISLKGAILLDRIAGILLTAIAVILLANGFTDLVTARLNR